MQNVLKYPGSKTRIAEWICKMIPAHEVYLEPFFGGGAVFFNKQPARLETINDLSNEGVNYFQVLRNNADELIQLIELTPYSREEYNRSFEYTQNNIERARRFAVRCCQGFGCSNKYKNGFRSGIGKTSPSPSKFWDKFPDVLKLATQRLKNAQIENQNALEIIQRYNKKEVFVYIDPPYLLDTRKNYLYEYEMTDKEHIDLLDLLIKFKGKVMISSYENELYSKKLIGWFKTYKNTTAEGAVKRKEVVWMNYVANIQTELEI